jgi:hypothetical protein
LPGDPLSASARLGSGSLQGFVSDPHVGDYLPEQHDWQMTWLANGTNMVHYKNLRHQHGSNLSIPGCWRRPCAYDTMQQQRFLSWHASCLMPGVPIFTHLPLGARCLSGDKPWQ